MYLDKGELQPDGTKYNLYNGFADDKPQRYIYRSKQTNIRIANPGPNNLTVAVFTGTYTVKPNESFSISNISGFTISSTLRQAFVVESWMIEAPNVLGVQRIPIYKPDGFAPTWNPPINLWEDEYGNIYTDFDVTIYAPTGQTYYVDGTNGSDTNDGLTLATAYKTIKKATDQVDVVVVLVARGIYPRADAFNGSAVTKSGSLAIKALPGHKVRLVNTNAQTWVQHGTYTNLYSTAASATNRIFDDKYPLENGDIYEYKKQSDVVVANTTPGTYWQSGSTVYINTIDKRVPDTDVMVFRDLLLAQFNDGTFYLEGISLEGGNFGSLLLNKAATAPKLYAKNCAFKYSLNDAQSAGGLTVLGASEVFLQDCVADWNYNDGYNYHIKTGSVPNVIEVNCSGRNNGVISDTDNGSTMHDGGKIVRVNCRYTRNKGSNSGDIHPNTQAWELGVICEDSTSTELRYNADFVAHEDATKWLHSCKASGSLNSLTVQNNAKIYYRNCDFSGQLTVEGTGQIASY